MAKGENQRSVERAVERMRGEPGPELPKNARQRLLGQDGAPIETPPRNAQDARETASGLNPVSPDLRAKSRQADGEKPWSYGAGRCLVCGVRPVHDTDLGLSCLSCGWRWRFNVRTGRWEPQ